MHILTMAFRNIFRNRRRSLLAVLSILIGVWTIVLAQGFVAGMLGSVIKNYTKNETGHVRITSAYFAENSQFLPVRKPVTDPDSVLAAIRAVPELEREIAFAAQRISFGVLLNSGGRSKTALGVAGDPDTERKMLMLDRSLVPGGTYLAERGETIIGSGLADTLGLKVGDTLKVVATASDSGLGMKKFRVSGIFNTSINTLDGNVFQIGIEDAKKLLKTGNGTQAILIMLKDYTKARQFAVKALDALRDAGLGEGLAVVPWNDIGEYPKLMATMENLYGFIYFIIVLFASFIIANIMMMVVLERRHEIGILKSMGFKKPEILFLFVAEGTFLGIGGAAMGAALGTASVFVLHVTGINVTELMSSFPFPMETVFYPPVSPFAIASLALLGVIVAAGVSFFPSRKAASMNPIDAIKSA